MPRGIFFRSPIQILTPPDRKGFSKRLYYKAVRCSECTLKLVLERSSEGTWKWSTCRQPRSQCFSIPFYFLQSFWVQYFASNTHVFSGGYLPKTSTMALQWYTTPKQYRALLELHITKRQLESPRRQHAAQLTIWNKLLCYFTTTRKQCVSIFSKDDRNFFFLTND